MAESPSPRTGQTLDGQTLGGAALGFPSPAAPPQPQGKAKRSVSPAAEQITDLTLLCELTERLTAATGLDEALHAVLQAGAAILGAQRGMLLLSSNADPNAPAFGTVDSPGSTVGFNLDRPALGALETVPRDSGPYAGLLHGESKVFTPGPIATRTVLAPAALDSAVLDPAALDSAVLDPAVLKPSVFDSEALDPAALDPAVFDGAVLDAGGRDAQDGEDAPAAGTPGARFREVAAQLGIGASYALPLATPGTGDEPFGAAVWFYDAPAVPSEHARRLAGLYCSAASRLITKEVERDRLRRTADTLRRGLLPDRLPRVPGVRLAARCLPAGLDLSAGSDWYDALDLPDGGLALSVGSVSGGGPDSAAAMGRIRAALRAYAVLEGEDPVAILGDLELLLRATEPARTATALYVYVDPRTRQLSLAGAGQCPPLLVTSFGASFVETSLSAPLGMLSCWEAPGVELRADRGDLLLLYTEGLARRCGHSLYAGQAKLRSAAAAAPRDARQDPERFCAHLLSSCLGGSDAQNGSSTSADDIVLLAARFD